MAAGDATRWGNHLGIPKHLVDIDGEPLLARTVRQLGEIGADVIVLGHADRRYHVPGGFLAYPAFRAVDTDKFMSSMEWWSPNDRTLIVYGDCYLSERAISEFLVGGLGNGLTFIGRSGPSSFTGCNYGELFGVVVTPEMHGRLAAAILRVRGLLLAGELERGGGWEVYRATQHLPLDAHVIADNFADLDDWSEDFDFPSDYDQWLFRRGAAR